MVVVVVVVAADRTMSLRKREESGLGIYTQWSRSPEISQVKSGVLLLPMAYMACFLSMTHTTCMHK